MPSWPSTWVTQALTAAGIPVTVGTHNVMRAWKRSTPLQPYTNNPIGMPAGSSGAPALLRTGYALFPSMSAFYAAFATFMKTYQGHLLAADMIGEAPYPESWRDIAALNWPGSVTETDYPSALLDLTTEAYRLSVKATPASDRKTSGQVQPRTEAASVVLANARSVANAVGAISDATTRNSYLLRKHAGNG
jgi:hypothetical protein